MGYWDDVFGSDRDNRRHVRLPVPDNLYINTMLVSSINKETSVTIDRPDLISYNVTEEMETKIREHLQFIESLFAQQCSQKKLTIRPVWGPVATGKPEIYKILAETVGEEYNDQLKNIFNLFKKGHFPEIDLVIMYVIGNQLGTGNQARSYYRTFDDDPHPHFFIVMSETATWELLAHELGHILNYSNINGPKNDPHPKEGDPGHNKNEGNLMYPTVTTTEITEQQCNQFFESKIIRTP
ncbi:hypothetical protein [Bacillus cereus]|uniref:hypothetical protein n=1 Tax=Bacillus cereus TaxID=1396 RepID=UPI0018F46B30|nr:hypothetical protein [Bacillus cereus]MBJ8151342.1 hypothetical protein [Bacillus cereus]